MSNLLSSLPRTIHASLALAVIVFVVLFFLTNLYDNPLNYFIGRISVDFGDNGVGGEARVFLWLHSFEIFMANPVFGSQTTTVYGYPHNLILEILMSIGLVGFIIFAYVLFSTRRAMRAIAKTNPNLVWIFPIFYQHLIGALFSGTIYSSNLVWYSLGISVAVAAFQSGPIVVREGNV